MKVETDWIRSYVCAENKAGAVDAFIRENPPLTMDALVRADQFEVERCE
mgnify:FL=1